MITQGNLSIIGSSHIAKQSVSEVKDAIDSIQPEIIALELDAQRAYALLHKNIKKDNRYIISRIGLGAFAFAKVAEYIQNKLGEIVSMKPGAEMITALKLAKEKNIKVAYIDQEIELTIRKLSKRVTFGEKFKLFWDFVKAMVFKSGGEKFDLSTVPDNELVAKLLSQVKERYPNLYNVLVKERNIIMARNIEQIMIAEPDKKILAIVGAGHAEDIYGIIMRHTSEPNPVS
jgi:pheromone shutdown-related protein TraB